MVPLWKSNAIMNNSLLCYIGSSKKYTTQRISRVVSKNVHEKFKISRRNYSDEMGGKRNERGKSEDVSEDLSRLQRVRELTKRLGLDKKEVPFWKSWIETIRNPFTSSEVSPIQNPPYMDYNTPNSKKSLFARAQEMKSSKNFKSYRNLGHESTPPKNSQHEFTAPKHLGEEFKSPRKSVQESTTSRTSGQEFTSLKTSEQESTPSRTFVQESTTSRTSGQEFTPSRTSVQDFSPHRTSEQEYTPCRRSGETVTSPKASGQNVMSPRTSGHEFKTYERAEPSHMPNNRSLPKFTSESSSKQTEQLMMSNSDNSKSFDKQSKENHNLSEYMTRWGVKEISKSPDGTQVIKFSPVIEPNFSKVREHLLNLEKKTLSNDTLEGDTKQSLPENYDDDLLLCSKRKNCNPEVLPTCRSKDCVPRNNTMFRISKKKNDKVTFFTKFRELKNRFK